MWIYVIFPAKIWRWISFIFNSNVLMFLLWRCRVLVWKFLQRKWKEVVFFVVQVVLVLAFKLSSILINTLSDTNTAWKVSKYGVFFILYFPVFGTNTEIYGANLYSVRKSPYSVRIYENMDQKNSVCKLFTQCNDLVLIYFWLRETILKH